MGTTPPAKHRDRRRPYLDELCFATDERERALVANGDALAAAVACILHMI